MKDRQTSEDSEESSLSSDGESSPDEISSLCSPKSQCATNDEGYSESSDDSEQASPSDTTSSSDFEVSSTRGRHSRSLDDGTIMKRRRKTSIDGKLNKSASSKPKTSNLDTSSRSKRLVKKRKQACGASGQEKITVDENCSHRFIYGIIGLICIIPLILIHISAQDSSQIGDQKQLRLNLQIVDDISNKYPGLLKPKDRRLIKARLAVMQREISILMLLGRTRDRTCNTDPTYCIGRSLVNVTSLPFAYIDASSDHLNISSMQRELSNSMDGPNYTAMIDSLERLPGSEVLSLFQFIDKDVTNKRRGLLLFVVYQSLVKDAGSSMPKPVEIVETLLTSRWSSSIRKDTLDSLISRLSHSIVKIT